MNKLYFLILLLFYFCPLNAQKSFISFSYSPAFYNYDSYPPTNILNQYNHIINATFQVHEIGIGDLLRFSFSYSTNNYEEHFPLWKYNMDEVKYIDFRNHYLGPEFTYNKLIYSFKKNYFVYLGGKSLSNLYLVL